MYVHCKLGISGIKVDIICLNRPNNPDITYHLRYPLIGNERSFTHLSQEGQQCTATANGNEA